GHAGGRVVATIGDDVEDLDVARPSGAANDIAVDRERIAHADRAVASAVAGDVDDEDASRSDIVVDTEVVGHVGNAVAGAVADVREHRDRAIDLVAGDGGVLQGGGDAASGVAVAGGDEDEDARAVEVVVVSG